MGLRITDAIVDGVQRTFTRNGLLLVAATYVVLLVPSLFAPVDFGFDVDADEPTTSPLVGDSEVLGSIVSLLGVLVSLYIVVVAYRTFTSDETETIPDAYLRDRPVWTVLNVLLGGIAFWILVSIGLVLFVLPGLFLLVTLWFFGVFVAVENDDFLTAMRESWSLTAGNRLQLFGLGVIVVVIAVAVGIAFGIPQTIAGGVVGQVIGTVGSAFVFVFAWATTAVAYVQLRERRAVDEATPEST